MSVIYRERERGRGYDDAMSSVSAHRGANHAVKRTYYKVKDDDDHSTIFDDRRYAVRGPRPHASFEETRIMKREREEPDFPPERLSESSYSRRERVSEPHWDEDLVIRRTSTKEAKEPSQRDFRFEEPVSDRELVIRRTDRDGREDVQIERYKDHRRDYHDFEVISPQRENFGEVQKITRAEYYAPPSQPQSHTIVIHNEPIILERRDGDYALIHRSEVDGQVARRAPSPTKRNEYFYERKTVERNGRPTDREDDFYAGRDLREVSPGDSVSRVGGRHRSRSRGRSHYSESDESMVYVRKETKEGSRSESPHHRRHVAEGALAGFGAAELLRHHKKAQGKETSGPLGRLGKDVGAGVLGAVAATGISKAKNRARSKSRRRERSESFDRDERRSRRHRSHSSSRPRSQSHSRLKTIGGLALAAAAGTALVVANRRSKNNGSGSSSGERRSRSRHRRHSASEATDDVRTPAHRKKRIAEAGAAGAVVAGLIEHSRSRSRKRNGERSRSRIRTGLPIAAAGLGSAAMAGIYERNKAKKEIEAAAAAERKRSRSRSRSRSRARSAYSEAPPGGYSDRNLIEYGDEPLYSNIPPAHYYPDQSYSEATVPAAAGVGAAYGSHREPRRHHSRDRRRSSSESSDVGRHRRHRRHSRSQSKGLATPALAAIGGGIAATEYAKMKEKKKAEKARRRYEAEHGHGHDPYEDEYDPIPPRRYTPTPPSSAEPYAHQNQYYRSEDQLPPPPGPAPPPLYPPQPPTVGYPPQQGPYTGQPPYNPAAYAQQPGPLSPPNPGYPSPGNYGPGPGYAPGTPFASGGNGDPRFPRGPGDENVSPPPNGNLFPGEARHAFPDGVNESRIPSPPPQHPSIARSNSQPAPASKNVAFDLGSDGSRVSSPDLRRHDRRGRTSRGYDAEDDSESPLGGRDQRYPTHHPISETESDPEKSTRRRKQRRRQPGHPPSHRSHRLSRDPDSVYDPPSSPIGSDVTVELPERFDEEGRKKPERGEDVVADLLEDFLSGKGPGGKYLNKIFGGTDDDAEGSSGRRRRRR